ncbi:MAG: TylF/MycF/NovP-related O-methyltransferase [Vicinamibacteria bacterium]
MRRGPGTLYRSLQSLRFLATRDRRAAIEFTLAKDLPGVSLAERLSLLRRFVRVTHGVRGYHTLTEMLSIARAILARAGRRPIVLEAGCGYGASTAKLSLAARLASGSLIACDSFRGMPENQEKHELMDGRATEFRAGAFRGTLASVKGTVEKWGAIEVCRFEKGYFADTLPRLPRECSLDVVVLDVDLAASTRECVRELWPRLRSGGVLFSLDGQLRATHELLSNPGFWRDEVGAEPPAIEGLGYSKLLTSLKT